MNTNHTTTTNNFSTSPSLRLQSGLHHTPHQSNPRRAPRARTWCAIATSALALTCTTTHAQDLGHKAPPQTHTIYINHATIHTVSGETITNGGIVFENGIITTILDTGMVTGFAPGTDVIEIDATGLHVYPGLISPYSQLGLTEIQAVRSTQDMAETRPMSPEVRAAVAINPDSTLFPVTRSNGILLAGVFPTASLRISGPEPLGLIPGRAALVRLDGWTTEDMAVLPDAGLVINFPLSRPFRAWWMEQSEADQTAGYERAIAALDTFFDNAVAYHAARETDDTLPTDLRYEAVEDVLSTTRDQLPTFFRANDYDQITGALNFAAEHNLRPIIVGGRDSHLCLDALKAADAAVILETSFRMPKRDDSPYDDLYKRPQQLQAAGIRYSFMAGDDTAHERNLPYAAALAVAHGLPASDALHALTLGAAEIFGVADTFGSLEPGKSATLIVTTGHPLDVLTTIELAFIDGRAIDLENKHTKLADKYREKYKQLGIIQDDE
ncbi:MAG: amidohydrolase family protein [Planctomycetota bacterium]|nr:amidohydrolase family protein [Planctomycetota bacterium]